MTVAATAARRATWAARPLPAGIAGRVRELREKLSWTQETLAAAAGVATITVRQIESGKRSPKLETARKLAAALEVPVDHLMPEDRP
jgi:DNA-binding XRE family transcriptional regulator